MHFNIKFDPKKIPAPDYRGKWELNKSGESGMFAFHILRIGDDHQEFDHHARRIVRGYYNANLNGYEKVFEGIITDSNGLALASGVIGDNVIEFYKQYSNLALQKGGLESLFYHGRSIAEGKYAGQFNAAGQEASTEYDIGTFCMKKVA